METVGEKIRKRTSPLEEHENSRTQGGKDKHKRLRKAKVQEHEPWNIDAGDKNLGMDFVDYEALDQKNFQNLKKTERAAAMRRRFAGTILRAQLKMLDCVKWQEKMKANREERERDEELARKIAMEDRMMEKKKEEEEQEEEKRTSRTEEGEEEKDDGVGDGEEEEEYKN